MYVVSTVMARVIPSYVCTELTPFIECVIPKKQPVITNKWP